VSGAEHRGGVGPRLGQGIEMADHDVVREREGGMVVGRRRRIEQRAQQMRRQRRRRALLGAERRRVNVVRRRLAVAVGRRCRSRREHVARLTLVYVYKVVDIANLHHQRTRLCQTQIFSSFLQKRKKKTNIHHRELLVDLDDASKHHRQ
jgi:acetolactate synthase small subunit